MKNLVSRIMAAAVLASIAVISNAEVIKQEMPACVSEDLLDEITNYIIKADRQSYMPLLRSGQCIRLDPGMNVSVIKQGFTVYEIRFNGVKLYTPSKALR